MKIPFIIWREKERSKVISDREIHNNPQVGQVVNFHVSLTPNLIGQYSLRSIIPSPFLSKERAAGGSGSHFGYALGSL